MEDIELPMIASGLMRFPFDLNLSDERRDGLNGIGHGEYSHRRQACIRQPGVHAFADSPDLGFAGLHREGLDRKVGDDIVELADQALIRAEHHRADAWCPVVGAMRAASWLFRKQRLNPSATVRL